MDYLPYFSSPKGVQIAPSPPPPTFPPSYTLWNYVVLGLQGLTVLTIISVVFYYILKLVHSYVSSKAYAVSFTILDEGELRVGRTITGTLRFTKLQDNLEPLPCSPTDLRTLNQHLIFHLMNEEEEGRRRYPVSYLHHPLANDGILLQFSLRKSGSYEPSFLYDCFHFVDSPAPSFHVGPGSFSLERTTLDTPNPYFITLTSGIQSNVGVLTFDRCGNRAPITKEDADKFSIKVKQGDSYVDVEKVENLHIRFLHHHPSSFSLNLRSDENCICSCILLYDGRPLPAPAPSSHSPFTFLLISLSEEEEGHFNTSLWNYFCPVAGSCGGRLQYLGAERAKEDDPREVWVNLNYKQISISCAWMGLVYYPFLIYPIYKRTKVSLIRQIPEEGQREEVSLKISDGIQDSVTIQMKSADARIFLAAFGHFKGKKLEPKTFQEKRNKLQSELGGLLPNFVKSLYILQLDENNILSSSMLKCPNISRDWMKPFVVTVHGSKMTGKNITPVIVELPTETWLSNILRRIFPQDEKGEEEERGGTFMKYPGSLRFHPNLRKNMRMRCTKEEMGWIGSIVGKAVHDSIVYGSSVDLTFLRFSKTMLASLIGIPVNYGFFQSDHPTYYKEHVLPLLESEDGAELGLKFQTPNGEAPLIPDGNMVEVNQRNKLYYLNLLSIAILKNAHGPEIEAFRSGFYKLIPQSLIVEFEVDELEKLINGGCWSFSVKDLKAHHRVFGELLDHQGLSEHELLGSSFSEGEQEKLLEWFWVVVENMGEEEHELLVNKVTGGVALPPKGFRDLRPKFTIMISKVSPFPLYDPKNNLISIGNATCFGEFEQAILDSLYTA